MIELEMKKIISNLRNLMGNSWSEQNNNAGVVSGLIGCDLDQAVKICYRTRVDPYGITV